MKKRFWMTLFGLGAAAVLAGCPIYSDNSGRCDGYYSDCNSGTQCSSDFDCPTGTVCGASNYCVSTQPVGEGGTRCTKPSDCPTGQNCGSDLTCHLGDCTNTQCPTGYTCKLSGGTVQCVGNGADGGFSEGGPPFTGCHNDAECSASGAGSKCLNGTCVKPADQCSDATQCPANELCVGGVCTPACDATHPCPTGYTCDTANGVCSGNTTPCGAGGTTCPASLTCVDQHCVTPCGQPGNTCPSGLVCVDGGCIPNQIPNFVCGTEGQPGDGKSGNCAVGSLCLHHNCYIACSPDAGTDACKTADKFNVCKQVTTSTGTYSVCGSTSNLGSQCDPTTGKQCPSSTNVCVDGFCK